MSKVIVIGAGGVGTVVVHKLAQNSDVFTEILLASRTKSKCDAIARDVKQRYGVEVKTAAVDADKDRKSTRLNSSHTMISYAVFCLTNKKIGRAHV